MIFLFLKNWGREKFLKVILKLPDAKRGYKKFVGLVLISEVPVKAKKVPQKLGRRGYNKYLFIMDVVRPGTA